MTLATERWRVWTYPMCVSDILKLTSLTVGFVEFTADSIDFLKDEIVDRLRNLICDWEGVEKSRLFQTQRQKRRRDLGGVGRYRV